MVGSGGQRCVLCAVCRVPRGCRCGALCRGRRGMSGEFVVVVRRCVGGGKDAHWTGECAPCDCVYVNFARWLDICGDSNTVVKKSGCFEFVCCVCGESFEGMLYSVRRGPVYDIFVCVRVTPGSHIFLSCT